MSELLDHTTRANGHEAFCFCDDCYIFVVSGSFVPLGINSCTCTECDPERIAEKAVSQSICLHNGFTECLCGICDTCITAKIQPTHTPAKVESGFSDSTVISRVETSRRIIEIARDHEDYLWVFALDKKDMFTGEITLVISREEAKQVAEMYIAEDKKYDAIPPHLDVDETQSPPETPRGGLGTYWQEGELSIVIETNYPISDYKASVYQGRDLCEAIYADSLKDANDLAGSLVPIYERLMAYLYLQDPTNDQNDEVAILPPGYST